MTDPFRARHIARLRDLLDHLREQQGTWLWQSDLAWALRELERDHG